MAGTFDRIIWLGDKPLNKARETLLGEVLAFLDFSGAPGDFASLDESFERRLVLGNLEDWSPTWPEADAEKTYLGLFFRELPSSGEVLERFESKKITFYWNETSSVESLREALSDLLLS